MRDLEFIILSPIKQLVKGGLRWSTLFRSNQIRLIDGLIVILVEAGLLIILAHISTYHTLYYLKKLLYNRICQFIL